MEGLIVPMLLAQLVGAQAMERQNKQFEDVVQGDQ
jgi:hypothetical protein